MNSVTMLNSGEYICLNAIEITSIPHYSILDSSKNLEFIINEYKKDMQILLKEAYQSYKNLSIDNGFAKDISFELIWITEKVENQPFNACIKLFFIIRAIEKDLQTVERISKEFTNIFKNSISSQKYNYIDVAYDSLKNKIINICDDSINAIVKEEKVENLQNAIMTYCYSFDKISAPNYDLSKLVSVLTQYPNCAISFQLIPTFYNKYESTEIDQVTQILDTLSNGIVDHSIGNVSFALARKHSEIYKYYSDNKVSPLFLYNILVYGDEEASSVITSRLNGQLSSGNDSQINLKTIRLDTNEVNKNSNFYPLPWAVNEIILNKKRNSQIWNSGQIANNLYRLPYIITSEEAATFFRLPIGCENISAGLTVNESNKNSKTYNSNIINSGDITVGKLKSDEMSTIGISLADLAKHMLIVGTPGSGKTTFSISLLDRLWKDHNIPFLVIEPAKNEYRALIQSIPDLQVFTPGKNFISPFIFNPFVPPKNVKLETYKSTLKTAFAAGVSMSSPLDKIFEESINNCYSDFRWLDTYTVEDKGKIFNISDFIKCFQETFDEIGYTGDAKNIGRAGVVRLRSLVNLFDNYFSIPIEDMLSKPTIIELSSIENNNEKSLIIALLLLSILAYVNANYVGEGGLKNTILLEEAHVLLDSTMKDEQGDANPSEIAQRLLKRMLAEIRSYGVGIIIADQSPRKVGTDVVALTDMKMVFRLVENEDKKIISNSTGMSENQEKRLAKLKPGESFIFYNKLDEPEEINTPDYRYENNISISLSDNNIKQLSTYWKDRQEKLRPYPECINVKYCHSSCDYSRRLLAKEIARRIYKRYMNAQTNDKKIIQYVFQHLSLLIKNELNDEPYSIELSYCVKVHLFRKVKYTTKIKISDETIENVLKK